MVRGLKTFVKHKVRNGQKIVAIEQKIEEWKCANQSATPVIVIDFPSFYRLMCNTKQGQLDVLFGNHEYSLNQTESVLRRFKNMGVELVMFYGGSSKFTKNPELISKRQDLSLKHITSSVLDMIKPENSPQNILQHVNCPIYNNGSYFVAAIMLAEKYSILHKSYYNECEREIAMYATRHNAVAIISADYEFVLVNSKFQRSNGTTGQWNFWDLSDFNPTTFQILQIDKIEVQNTLGLSDDELPIFGVLTGNNFPGTLVDEFLNKFGDHKQRFENVAKFIKEKFSKKGVIIPVKIANVLSPGSKNKITQIAEETLKFFANIIEPDLVCEDKFSIAAKRIHNSYAYEYLNNLHVPVQSLYWRKTAYTSFMEFALMIHRRQMGVVLQHKVTKLDQCIICIDPKGTTIKSVQPVYPALKVPSLSSLYNKVTDKALLETKLKLLCWIVSDQLNYKSIENIPKQYLCAVLTLVYMVESLFISSEEADCILYCLQEYNTNPDLVNSLPYPDSISEQPFQLVFLYDKFHQFMSMSMNTVGLSDLMMHNQLNGVYFHMQYEQVINYPADERDYLLNPVNDYRLYLNK